MSRMLDGTRFGLAGVAAGIMIAVLYLRYGTFAPDSLNELRDGAILLLAVSVLISLYQFHRAHAAREG